MKLAELLSQQRTTRLLQGRDVSGLLTVAQLVQLNCQETMRHMETLCMKPCPQWGGKPFGRFHIAALR